MSSHPHEFKKILSLDGGGSWALIQAYCLKNLFPNAKSGHEILAHFDLAVANSGGSLLLAGLLANKTPDELIQMFRTDKIRNSIFKKKKFPFIHYLMELGPKYVAKEKLTGIRAALGEAANEYITEIPQKITNYRGKPLQFVIVNFDYRRNRAYFHRSYKNSLADSSYCELFHQNGHQHLAPESIPAKDTTLAEAVHGSSNAPVNFFDEPAQVKVRNENFTHEMWDGAVGGYNNPVLAGTIEAIVNGTDPSNIKVLSVGTGNNDLELRRGKQISKLQEIFYEKEEKSFWIKDIPKLAKSILNDPPDAASYHAFCLLGLRVFEENKRFFRFNPLVKPVKKSDGSNEFACPEGLNAEQFQFLSELEMDATEPIEIAAIEHFAKEWIQNKIPNQPIRAGKSIASTIGESTYQEAFERFNANFHS